MLVWSWARRQLGHPLGRNRGQLVGLQRQRRRRRESECRREQCRRPDQDQPGRTVRPRLVRKRLARTRRLWRRDVRLPAGWKGLVWGPVRTGAPAKKELVGRPICRVPPAGTGLVWQRVLRFSEGFAQRLRLVRRSFLRVSKQAAACSTAPAGCRRAGTRRPLESLISQSSPRGAVRGHRLRMPELEHPTPPPLGQGIFSRTANRGTDCPRSFLLRLGDVNRLEAGETRQFLNG